MGYAGSKEGSFRMKDLDQKRRGEEFRRLHAGPTFVVPNPWDAGSARVFAGLGFAALATTSGGLAAGLGKPDGQATREETLANVAMIAAAAGLPVTADLEAGFGTTPADVASHVFWLPRHPATRWRSM